MGNGPADADKKIGTDASHALSAFFREEHIPEFSGDLFRIIGYHRDIGKLLFQNIFAGKDRNVFTDPDIEFPALGIQPAENLTGNDQCFRLRI